MYRWGFGVLSFLYRHLCEACRRASQHASIGGCVYLFQLWMWSHLPVGQPTVLAPRPWFDVATPRPRPMVAYLLDQVKAPFSRSMQAYVEYTNELDTLTPLMVRPLHSILSFHFDLPIVDYMVSMLHFDV
jgi:hypothetical protein